MMDQNRRPEPLGTREKWGRGEGLEREAVLFAAYWHACSFLSLERKLSRRMKECQTHAPSQQGWVGASQAA